MSDEDERNIIDPSLSRRMDIELRREMEAAERDAAVLAAKQRTLADVMREYVSRGDRLTVAAGDFEVTGVGAYARGDLLTIRSATVIAEINVAALDWVRLEERVPVGGQSSPVEAESFLARLGLLEITGERVEVVGDGGRPRIHGTITAVARDHIVVTTDAGRPWYLPAGSVAAVMRQLPH